MSILAALVVTTAGVSVSTDTKFGSGEDWGETGFVGMGAQSRAPKWP